MKPTSLLDRMGQQQNQSVASAVYDERYSSRCYQDTIHALEMKLHSLLSVYKNSNTALPELNYYLGFKVDIDWYMEKV